MQQKQSKIAKGKVKKSFWWEKKLTMRDFKLSSWWKRTEIWYIDDRSSQNTESNGITMTIIDDTWNINRWIYTISDDQVQKFFQFIKEKAFYQQLWPQIVMNKFKDIIWYDE